MWESVIGAACSMCSREGQCMLSFVGKCKGKISLERGWRRWKGNVEMNLREMRWECVDWVRLAQERDKWRAVVNTAMNLAVS